MEFRLLDQTNVRDFIFGMVHSPEGASVVHEFTTAAQRIEELKIDPAVKPAHDDDTTNRWVVTNQLSKEKLSLLLLQLLPSVRGEDASLPMSRLRFVAAAQRAFASIDPAHAPQVIFQDNDLGIIMVPFEKDYVALRADLVVGNVHPQLGKVLGAHLGKIAARCATLARSTWAPEVEKAFTESTETCSLGVAGVFDKLLEGGALPDSQLSPLLALLRANKAVDAALKEAKDDLSSSPQTLCHGALHTGRILVPAGKLDSAAAHPFKIAATDTFFEGPIVYDLCSLLAHLYICSVAWHARIEQQERLVLKGGYAKFSAERTMERWIANVVWLNTTIEDTWASFFLTVKGELTASGCALEVIDEQLRLAEKTAPRFIACEILRRILSAAPVVDIDSLTSGPDKLITIARLTLLAWKCLASSTSAEENIVLRAKEWIGSLRRMDLSAAVRADDVLKFIST